jgi:hypothetical protein
MVKSAVAERVIEQCSTLKGGSISEEIFFLNVPAFLLEIQW